MATFVAGPFNLVPVFPFSSLIHDVLLCVPLGSAFEFTASICLHPQSIWARAELRRASARLGEAPHVLYQVRVISLDSFSINTSLSFLSFFFLFLLGLVLNIPAAVFGFLGVMRCSRFQLRVLNLFTIIIKNENTLQL